VDLERTGRPDGQDEVDDLGDLRPRRVHRDQERSHADPVRHDQGVTRMVDGFVDQETHVGDHRDQGVDQRVLPAEGPHPEPGGEELLAAGHGVDPLPCGTSQALLDGVDDGLRCPHLHRRVGREDSDDAVDGDVVGVLVRDEDSTGSRESLLDLGEGPGIHHQDRPVLLEPDARMGVLGQQHRLRLPAPALIILTLIPGMRARGKGRT